MVDSESPLVYIGLGSNLENPLHQVNTAIEEISGLPETTLIAVSSWYRSTPLGPALQPDYINGVVAVKTGLAPGVLLRALQRIENSHGRERTVRWGARTLDLDILVFGSRRVSSPQLEIPHPQLAFRNFVLYPLHELDPKLVLPDGEAVADLLAKVSPQGIVRLAEG